MKCFFFPEPIDSTCTLITDGGATVAGRADTHPSNGAKCQSYTIPDTVPNSNGATHKVEHSGYVRLQQHGFLVWGDVVPTFPADQAFLLIDVFSLQPTPPVVPPVDPPIDPPKPTLDEFPFSTASIVNSPAAILSWPITAEITGVRFEAKGWRVDFNRRWGAKAWPSVTSPGWDGPLQYTLGLCRRIGTSWVCSAVVEFWQSRLDEEGGAAGSPPDRIAQDWFYDSRWGALEGWQPKRGEEVGVFISAGDGRNTTVVFPGTVPQRTAAILVRWGIDR